MKNLKKRFVHKTAFVLIAILILAAAGTITVFAVANSNTIKTVENDFTPDEIQVAVIETGIAEDTSPAKTPELEWKQNGETYTAAKPVQIQNVDTESKNDANAYIRVCLIPRWHTVVTSTTVVAGEASSADIITEKKVPVDVGVGNYGLEDFGSLQAVHISGNTFQMGDVTFTLVDNWSENWIFNETDGYFYYKSIVAPGNLTESLLQGVSIPAEVHTVIQKNDIQLGVDVLADAIQTEGGALEARWGSPETLGIQVNSETGALESVV